MNTPQRVYLFVNDSFRWDYYGKKVDGRSLTPYMEALAQDGVYFSNAISNGTWSKPAAAAMLTGLYPALTGVFPAAFGRADIRYTRSKLDQNIRQTIGTLFQQAGFRTVGYSANLYVSRRFGMHTGFDHMPDIFSDPELQERLRHRERIGERIGKKKRVPALVTGADMHTIRQREEPSEGNLFTLFWTMDTHHPLFDRFKIDEVADADDAMLLRTVGSLRNNIGRAKSLYEKMVRFADEQLGTLIKDLQAQGLYDEALIILTGDHGEGFGENATWGHGKKPYEVQIHVPLIIKFPAYQYRGTVCDQLVAHIDLLPTLADWYGIPLQTNVSGVSLLPMIEGHGTARDIVIYDQSRHSYQPYLAVRSRKMKYLADLSSRDFYRKMPRLLLMRFQHDVEKISERDHRKLLVAMRWILTAMIALFMERLKREVFDVSADPYERHNILNSEAGSSFRERAQIVFDEHISMLNERRAELRKGISEAEMDHLLTQRLRDLGYLE